MDMQMRRAPPAVRVDTKMAPERGIRMLSRVLRAASVFLALSVPLCAMGSANPPQPAPFKFPRIEDRINEQWAMQSKEGYHYRILISKPSGHAPPSGYPVVYVLDGNAWTGVVAEIARLSELQVSPAIVVGIGYVTKSYLDERRVFDLSAPVPMTEPLPGPERKYGGADIFLNFIEDKVKSRVRSRFPVDSNRQVLFGHSLGGLFVLHVLFTHPRSFNSYIAASPSIWFNDRAIIKEEQEFSSTVQSDASRRLLVTAGELEQAVTAEEEERDRRFYERHPEFLGDRPLEQVIVRNRADKVRSRMVDNAKELAGRIHNLGVSDFFEFAGEDHMSVVPAALSRVLPIALRQDE